MEKERREVKVISYQTDYECDECKGEVVYHNPSGNLFSNSSGTHYPHKCKKCDKEYAFTDRSYPRIEEKIVEL